MGILVIIKQMLVIGILVMTGYTLYKLKIKECLEFAMDGCLSKFADIARAIEVADETTDDETATKKFFAELEKLCNTLEIPTLEKYGIPKDEFDRVTEKMASDAMASGSPSNTIKEVTEKDIIEIYKKLW